MCPLCGSLLFLIIPYTLSFLLLWSFSSSSVADWSVTIHGVYGSSIDFSTGNSVGADMKVEIYDVCRVDSATRTLMGQLFPFASTVTGMIEDHTGIVNNPGPGNKIAYSFDSAINTTSIFTDLGDDFGTVNFCAQVGLYDQSTLITLAEVKVQYTLDMRDLLSVTLNSQTITSAGGYTDAADEVVSFDGTLHAYFCNPFTYEALPYNGLSTNQGTTISVCFQIPDGQFEVKDVQELTVKNADDLYPQQPIVEGSNIVSSSIATKTCYDTDTSDTNVCVVQLLLDGEFYEQGEMTLTGTGTVVLELGDSPSGSRKLLRASVATKTNTPYRQLEETIEKYEVEPARFTMITAVPQETQAPTSQADDGKSRLASIITGCVFGAVLLVAFIYCVVSGRLDDDASGSEKDDVTSGSVGEGLHTGNAAQASNQRDSSTKRDKTSQ